MYGTPIYIGRYDELPMYRQNSADIYRQYLLIKVLRCCSTSMVFNVGKIASQGAILCAVEVIYEIWGAISAG